MKKIKLILFLPLLFVSYSCSTDDASFSIDSIISSNEESNLDSNYESSLDVSSESIIDWNETIYSWNDDNSMVTATRSRKDDESIVETETVNTNYEVILEATCHSLGQGRYTSNSFTNEAFETQRKNIYIDMLAHQYNTPTYIWEDDGSVCHASISCINEGCSHVIEENIEGYLIDYVAPTCQDDGSATYEAEFINTLFSRQETEIIIPSTGEEHVWEIINRSDYITWADFGDGGIIVPGTATYTCLRCGDTKVDYHDKFEWEIPLD